MRTVARLLSIAALLLGGCVGNIGDDADASNDDRPGSGPGAFACDPEAAALTASPIRRLSKTYFENAVRELLSPMDEASRTELLGALKTRLDLVPADTSEHYSANDTNVTEDHADAVFGVAVSLGSKIAENAAYGDQLVSVCGAGSTVASLGDDACLSTFVAHYGRKACRRPLAQAEIDDFKAFYQEATAQGVDGLGMLVGRFVAHPNFYYRFDMEGEVEDGAAGEDAVYVLTKWELLSKVTFLFWAAPPDDTLLDRVDSTDITKDEELAALVDDVLANPKAEQGILGFYREWLTLDTTKTPATEGNVVAGQAMLADAGIDALPTTHREDMIQETLDLARHYTLTTEGNLSDILTSPYSFARTDALAKIYGVSPWDGDPDHLVELPKGERSGLLTRAAFVSSGAEYTRPIIKGKLVRTRVLCGDISPPPPGLDIKPLTHPADETTRDAVEEATAGADCVGCHGQMNTLGFATETYDPIGRFRKKELRFADGTGDVVSELPIDSAVEADIGEEGGPTSVADGVSLSLAIAESQTADTCMAMSYFELVTGRDPDPQADGCDVVAMRDELGADGGSIHSMLKKSVLAASFRRRLID